jgi:hypothetical protein
MGQSSATIPRRYVFGRILGGHNSRVLKRHFPAIHGNAPQGLNLRPVLEHPGGKRRRARQGSCELLPSRPGEFHPEPLTEPDVSLSTYPARAVARRLPPSIEHRVPPAAG